MKKGQEIELLSCKKQTMTTNQPNNQPTDQKNIQLTKTVHLWFSVLENIFIWTCADCCLFLMSVSCASVVFNARLPVATTVESIRRRLQRFL